MIRWPWMALLLMAPGVALAAPKPADADRHVRSIPYEPHQVVRLRTAPRRATELAFDPQETIAHVALGESATWDVAVAGSMLFLKPKPGARETNLIVTTSGARGERTYVFELTLLTRVRSRAATSDYVVRLTDPAAGKTAAQVALQAARSALEAKVTALRLDRGVIEGPRNLAYLAQGVGELQPSEVSDNGRFTVLRFAGGQQIPAISTVDAAGQEAPARFNVRGEFVVVEGAWPGLRLRKGREVTCLTNKAWRPARLPGLTASPDLKRTDQGASS